MLNKKLLGSVSSPPSDDNFENVSLLLSGDGTNGAQNNTFLDSSTNNFTITRNGNTTQGSFSPYGSNWSNYFSNASGMSLAFPSNAAFAFGTGDFTVEGWINGSGLSGAEKGIWGIGPTGGVANNTTIRINAGKFSFWCGGSGNNVATNTTLSDGVWYHFALVRQSGTFRFYINGVQDTTSTTGGSYNQTAESGKIGQNYNDQNIETFNGYISNLRVVKGTAVYPNGTTFTPSTTPLTAIANTSLLACQNNRFVDNSSNAFALTVNGTPSVQRFSPFNPTAPYSTSVIGGSGYFDGSGDFLSTPSTGQFNPTGDFTVSCWFNLQSFANTYYVIGGTWNTGTSDEWLIQLDNAGAIRFLTTSGTSFSSSGVVKLNCWNYFAAVRSGSTLTVYLNGSSLYSYTLSGTPFTASKSIRIGLQPDGSWPWNGYISDFRLVAGSAITTVPTAPQTAVSGTSLLLNFTNASIADLAMQNNLETVGNAQVSTSVKKYGTGSLAFDGSGDWLSIPNTPNLQLGSGNFTIEGWINFSSLASNRGIMYFGTNPNSNFSYGLQWAGNALYFWYTTNGSSLSSVSASWTPSTSVWYHLAVTRSGNDLKFFIDGTQIGTTQSLSGVTIFNSTDVIRIGGEATGSPNSLPGTMNGYIDDLRITRGLARYVANFTPAASALPTY